MLSIEQFVKMCAEHIKRREYFIAYWHPHGFGLLRTGEVMIEEWDVYLGMPDDLDKHHATTADGRDNIITQARRRGDRVDHIKTVYKPKKARKGTVSKMHRVIAQLRKDRRCQPLYVVEYDDIGLVTDGGEEVYALQSVLVSGGGDPVDA